MRDLILYMLVFLMSGCTVPEPYRESAKPIHPGTRIIQNNELVVEIMDPRCQHRYNTGTRFTPVAAILRVKHRGLEYLYNPLQPGHPDKQVAGLMAEFDIYTPSGPPGFAEAKEGDSFLKVGVGFLRRTQSCKKGYKFWPTYPVTELAETRVNWGKDRAEFTQSISGENGFGYYLQADVRLDHNVINITWVLKNIGSRTIRTIQYTHNCTRFGSKPVGDGYRIELPYMLSGNNIPGAINVEGRTLRVIRQLDNPLNISPSPASDLFSDSNTITVKDDNTGGVLEYSINSVNTKLAVHMSADYICPEQFLDITLNPGESQKWVRKYLFTRSPDQPVAAQQKYLAD